MKVHNKKENPKELRKREKVRVRAKVKRNKGQTQLQKYRKTH